MGSHSRALGRTERECGPASYGPLSSPPPASPAVDCRLPVRVWRERVNICEGVCMCVCVCV